MDKRGPTEQVGDQERRLGLDALTPYRRGEDIDHVSILEGVAFLFGAAIYEGHNHLFCRYRARYIDGGAEDGIH